MPAQRDVADGEARERNAAETPPAAAQDGGATDEINVLWRKKNPAPTTNASDDASSEADAGEGDWQERLAAEQAKTEEYLTKWQRAAADMANMRRRHEIDRQEYTRQANADLISQLLPVLDSFDRALESMPEEIRAQSWVDGIILVERQLRTVLQRAGLMPIEADGKPFDPNEHEALMQEASDQPANTVIGELQRGYKLHDRVLRPAMVKVATE